MLQIILAATVAVTVTICVIMIIPQKTNKSVNIIFERILEDIHAPTEEILF